MLRTRVLWKFKPMNILQKETLFQNYFHKVIKVDHWMITYELNYILFQAFYQP